MIYQKTHFSPKNRVRPPLHLDLSKKYYWCMMHLQLNLPYSTQKTSPSDGTHDDILQTNLPVAPKKWKIYQSNLPFYSLIYRFTVQFTNLQPNLPNFTRKFTEKFTPWFTEQIYQLQPPPRIYTPIYHFSRFFVLLMHRTKFIFF